MGASWSCPLAFYLDLENGFESALKSIETELDKPKVLCSSSSGKSTEGYVRFRARKEVAMSRFMPMETIDLPSKPSPCSSTACYPNKNSEHEAAVKLQKVYKSFRTRRKLADCAVLIEQSWWKLLDFAELKHSSISFFDISKHETAVSKWSRARTRAAKVGKGLSENGKAQKLALQHWLEAIDPRHRYGHNLHFYYTKWLNSQSKEPFFYWLDIGEGKEINLVEKCPRLKLQLQCIVYLGPMERKGYEVAVEEGKLIYTETRELLSTIDEPKGCCKWIFVLSTSRTLYVGKKKRGSFQHSSFLAGGATLAAGRIVAENGILKAVWPHSGHYRPTPENFQDFLSFLGDNNVDLTDVKLESIDEEDSSTRKHARSYSSSDDFFEKERASAGEGPTKPNSLLIPPSKVESEADEVIGEGSIPAEQILERINSHKKMKSFQLGKQLSCRWSTGAGPRIGCLRDYPSGMQCQALEQVNLSPRSRRLLRFEFPTRSMTPTRGSNLSRSLVAGNDRV